MDDFHPWRWFFGILGVVALVWATFTAIGWITQPARTAEQVRERTFSGNNVIFQYERFHDLCASVVTWDKQAADAEKTAKDYDKRTDGKDDPIGRIADESARLHQVADGIHAARVGAAEEYNAASRKLNEKLFKDKALPYRITDDTPDCGN